MPYFQAPDQSLHFLTDPAFAYLLPPGCAEITDRAAQELQQQAAAPTVPQSVTPVQAFMALDAAGKLPALMAYIDAPTTPPIVRATALGATEWRRDSLLLMSVGLVLGLNDAQVDELFIAAAQIKV